MSARELAPQEVLEDLLGSGDFPAEVLDPEAAAAIILRRLRDARFRVVDASDAELGMAWWNRLSDRDRPRWAELAGTGRVVDAWELLRSRSVADAAGKQDGGVPTRGASFLLAGSPRRVVFQSVFSRQCLDRRAGLRTVAEIAGPSAEHQEDKGRFAMGHAGS